MVTLPSPQGPATAVAPPGSLDGRPLAWPSPLTGYGADRPRWAGSPQTGSGTCGELQ
jgi:hypothetical protein